MAKISTFISYDEEFLQILGETPTVKLVKQVTNAPPIFFEAGAWDPVKNQVWMTAFLVNNTGSVHVLDLNTNKVFVPNTSIPIVAPNGGYFFDGHVYFTSTGTATSPPCIYAVDPDTYDAAIIINSYFGLRFNGIDDLVWVKRGDKKYLFFTDLPISHIYSNGLAPVIPDAVWRYDPQDQSVVPVISRADVLLPNGMSTNADFSKLYVTETPLFTFPELPGGQSSGSPAIYSYDLDENCFPINKRMLGICRTGVPDGLKVDDAGRIWTGEAEGIVVRNPMGKVIGIFNREALLDSGAPRAMANSALAGDTLVIQAEDRLFTVKMAQTLISSKRSQM